LFETVAFSKLELEEFCLPIRMDIRIIVEIRVFSGI